MLFDLGEPLTRRDAAAPDLLAALSLTSPSNSGPPSLALPVVVPTADEIASAHGAAPNDLQQAILALAATLPVGSASAMPIGLLAAARDQVATTQGTTAGDILHQIEAGFGRFFRAPGS